MRIDLDDNNSKLRFFQDLYQEATNAQAELIDALDGYLAQYKGTKEIDGGMDARFVRNITYELIESQVTGYIPTPKVTPKLVSERTVRNARQTEVLLQNLRNELPFERLNDIDERYSPIYGGSVWLVEWDDTITTHHTVGDVKVSCISPRHFVGQPYVYEVQDMEYCFVSFLLSTDEVLRRYGVDVSVAKEADGETDDHSCTVIVCYYKNDDDKVSQYVWTMDTELLDIEDYYVRRRKVCRVCGKREELCRCEHPKLETIVDEYETLTADITLSSGAILPRETVMVRDGQVVMDFVKRPVMDENGNMAVDSSNGVILPVVEEVPVPRYEETRLPYYVPSLLPVVVRKNTSQEDCVLGQSDCAFLKHHQQAINKIESRIQEKLLKSGVYPIVPEDFSGCLDNSVFENVLRAKPNEAGIYGRLDLQVDISRDIAEADRLYDQAKRMMGISNSFQGQYDASAQSGYAKQIQVQQSAGRLDSKRKMKNATYADIDKIIFQYYLAYSDEPRPATYVDANGTRQNCIFNRYDFIERDMAGEYYYEDGYMFETDSTIDIERSRETLWQENRANFQQGAYGNQQDPRTQLIFWQNMEKAHYPWANDNVERIKEQIEMLRQQQTMQGGMIDGTQTE